MSLRFLPINIYDHTAEGVPILQMQLTVQIQKLKYRKKSLKYKWLKCKSSLQQNKYFFSVSKKLVFSQLICF